MAHLYCNQCSTLQEFVPIPKARAIAGVSRGTIYYWIQQHWVHSRKLASGRTVICTESLSPSLPSDNYLLEKTVNNPKRIYSRNGI